MAKGIYDLGNGLGYIYATKADGTTITANIQNSPAGSFKAKALASFSRSVGTDLVAVGSIKIDTITGSGSITDITIDSVTQINAAINYTGATSVGSLASLITIAINSHYATGFDYIARLNSETATVYIYAPVEAGSSVNEQAISVTSDGNMTNTTTALSGGSDGDLVYDEITGHRFFLDADYGTTTCAGGGVAEPNNITNALEITNYIVPRALNAINPILSATIASGVLSIPTRLSSITRINVSNESAAATDALTYISTAAFSEGDLLTLYNDTASTYFTIATGEVGNMVLVNAIKVGDYTYAKDIFNSITFLYSGGIFTEIGRGITKSNVTFGTVTYGATTTWDVLASPQGKLTMTGNATLAITNPTNGIWYTLIVTQDSTGGRVMTFPAQSHFKGGDKLLSTGANQVDILKVIYDGVRYRFELSKDYSSL